MSTRKPTQDKQDKASTLLGMTMLALGRIIEPTKTKVEVEGVEVEAEGSKQDDILSDLGVSFGDLEDLEIVEEV